MTMKINSLRFLFLWLFLVAAQSSARKNHAHGTSVIHQHGQRPLSRHELAVISQTRNNNSPAFESDSRVFLNTVVCVATLNLIINLTRPDPSVVWQVSKKYLWSIFVYLKKTRHSAQSNLVLACYCSFAFLACYGKFASW